VIKNISSNDSPFLIAYQKSPFESPPDEGQIELNSLCLSHTAIESYQLTALVYMNRRAEPSY
jgi:hypothetical protein